MHKIEFSRCSALVEGKLLDCAFIAHKVAQIMI